MNPPRLGIFAAVSALAALVGPVRAPCTGQDSVAEVPPPPPSDAPPAPPPAPPPEKLTFSVATGFQYIFETNIDGGGEVSLTRVPLQIGADWEISEDLTVSAGLRAELDLYDFNGLTPLGTNPWDDIYNLVLDARVTWALNQRTRLFGGPVVGWNRQSDASWGSSVTGGGLVGVTYAFNPKLILGAGVGFISQLDDDPLIYPIIIVNWRFTDQTYITSRAGPAGIAATGVELVHELGEGWEIGVGARYEYRRFRLNSTGIAPDGVGEETNFPAWIRLSYRFAESFKLDLYTGLAFFGRLSIDDDQGTDVAATTYDLAPTVALTGRLDF